MQSGGQTKEDLPGELFIRVTLAQTYYYYYCNKKKNIIIIIIIINYV